MIRVSVAALCAVAVLAPACGSDSGPGKPYGLKTVERSFRRHNVNTRPFRRADDPSLPANLSQRALGGDVLVGGAWDRKVGVAVYATPEGAAAHETFNAAHQRQNVYRRRANVDVAYDSHFTTAAEVDGIRAALAELG